jgi:hypothetical protein
MSILTNLTEGIVNRDLSKEGEAILNKWEKTGLLEGLENDFNRNQMAVLLENQAKELLRESNSMATGDVEGFAAVAFPIVRRVFGGLLAQKLVSVQPMSLPSGLIFFMDFLKQAPDNLGAGLARDGLGKGEDPSVYGGQVKGRQIETLGVNLSPEARTAGNQTPQFYDLVSGHSNARAAAQPVGTNVAVDCIIDLAGVVTDTMAKQIDFDADLLALESGKIFKLTVTQTLLKREPQVAAHPLFDSKDDSILRLMQPDLRHVAVSNADGTPMKETKTLQDAKTMTAPKLIRRLTSFDGTTLTLFVIGGGSALVADAATTLAAGDADGQEIVVEFGIADNIIAGPNSIGSVVGSEAWEMEGSKALPEIAIKVDSTAITAVTRKLKASWTPELAQDLNAYHNLDAEVELTGILSEQIALEIDQEILSDLIQGAKASKLYWSRRPGLFVNRVNGNDATSHDSPPDVTGSVSEWYETLIETINDVSADIHRKTLRGGANFLVCGPEVANILEFTAGFRASVTHDETTGSIGAVQIGSINKKWDLHVDPYFPRNVILVGRKGSSFLESGYVYAPYVPLQVTPTIFDPDTFTPRKAVMTRYGKKMVRPDMFGLVVVRDLEG